ncbi:MAG TPA: dihydrodipicolinate synthase family protein [Woeseiaceae bacterium]|nr:dihydrodipicolinate synthase family protein [Woeseiaceae bacterium]
MPAPERFSGVLAPVITPFLEDLAPDPVRLTAHCRWLSSHGAGLALFGTNSEGNSLSVGEKMELLDRLIEAGIEPARMMPGTGCSALTDSVELTRHAVTSGCGGVLMLPPFYYKGVSDEGLFRSYSEVIERIGSRDLRIYLYHIPPVSQVGISVELVARLVKAWPETVVGIKDSSGDWDNTSRLLALSADDFRVFSGSESFLLRNLRAGGAGCISATANINPAAISRLCEEWRSPEADALQQDLDEVRDCLQMPSMIPGLKAVVAHFLDDPAWETVRPPLTALEPAKKSALIAKLSQRGFTMPGLAPTGE